MNYTHSKELYACSLQTNQKVKVALNTYDQGNQQLIGKNLYYEVLEMSENQVTPILFHQNYSFTIQVLFLGELLISAGEKLQILRYQDHRINIIADLFPNTSTVTTCCDFFERNDHNLVSGSLDSTLREWDLNTKKCFNQTIATRNSPIIDLSLSSSPKVGCLLTKQLLYFDLRVKQICPFQIRPNLEYNIIKWNKQDDITLMAIDQETSVIDLYDCRNLSQPCRRLSFPSTVSNADWFYSQKAIVTGCDNGQLLINMGDYSESNYQLKKHQSIDNLCACGNYIGVVSQDKFELIEFKI